MDAIFLNVVTKLLCFTTFAHEKLSYWLCSTLSHGLLYFNSFSTQSFHPLVFDSGSPGCP